MFREREEKGEEKKKRKTAPQMLLMWKKLREVIKQGNKNVILVFCFVFFGELIGRSQWDLVGCCGITPEQREGREKGNLGMSPPR